jgi:hypothetical protein
MMNDGLMYAIVSKERFILMNTKNGQLEIYTDKESANLNKKNSDTVVPITFSKYKKIDDETN